ncbi:myotilin isoform X2 [Microcaecilia unicolor]|nr:myotilin isoform X2 [Microcaecilia unicolor]XP_030068623.1 myotilin isoform X2 [Microcaecilia unicolor]
MNITSLPSVSSMYQPSMFNYERPKHFIQSQPTCSATLQPNGTEAAKCTSSPLKQTSIVIHPQSSSMQKYPSSSSSMSSPRSPPFNSTNESAPPCSSTSISRGQVSLPQSQSPAAYLTSVLPSHPEYNSHYQAPTINVQSNYPKSVTKKMPTLAQQTSDEEIQGTKDALIQDLERKLRLKDNILHNGNQRLTYEERMARRLLGPENAASVFGVQNEENMQDSQKNSENSRLQVPTTLIRSRPSSREEREHGSIQEKFFPPRFVQVPEDLAIEEGRFCRLDLKVSGLPTPDVTWYLNGSLVRPDNFHKMIVSEKGFHSFIFEVVRAHDAGQYECVASNRAGQAKFRVQLDVLAQAHRRPPVFIQKPQSQRAFEGESVRMDCLISAMPAPQILLKRNNEMLQNNTDRISLLQDSSGKISLLIHNVSKKDAGWYTISAVNEAGIETCHARLDVATYANKGVQNTKPLKVRPTFSKYATLNGKGVNMRQAFIPGTEFQHMDSYAGMYESEEL